MLPADQIGGDRAGGDAIVPRAAWIGLAVLTAVSIVGSMDRAIIGIVLQPLKQEFHLSDSALGLLSGLAFALAHMVTAIPFGILADRVSRRRLVACAVAFWSFATSLGAFAQNLAQLVVCRAAVGVGEAAGQSAQISLVSDLFPPSRRATAVSIYYLNGPLGMMGALIGGGLVVAHFGWRGAFIAAAIPGFVLALLMLALREPARGASEAQAAPAATARFGDVLRFVRGNRPLLHISAALTVLTLASAGVNVWVTSFFIRAHGYTVGEIGPLLGIGTGIIGVIASPIGGILADRLARGDPRRRLALLAVALLIQMPLLIATFNAPAGIALGCYIAQSAVAWLWLGLGLGASQNMIPPAMRSTVSAMIYTVMGFVGFGLGPQVAGSLSDLFAALLGHDGLGLALTVVSLTNLWAIAHLAGAWRAMTKAGSAS